MMNAGALPEEVHAEAQVEEHEHPGADHQANAHGR